MSHLTEHNHAWELHFEVDHCKNKLVKFMEISPYRHNFDQNDQNYVYKDLFAWFDITNFYSEYESRAYTTLYKTKACIIKIDCGYRSNHVLTNNFSTIYFLRF